MFSTGFTHIGGSADEPKSHWARCLIPGSHDDAGVKRGIGAASCSSNWLLDPELGPIA